LTVVDEAPATAQAQAQGESTYGDYVEQWLRHSVFPARMGIADVHQPPLHHIPIAQQNLDAATSVFRSR
jgi:hypothetical protein